MSTQSPKAEGKPAPAGTSTLDLALQAVEYLVQQSRPASLAQIADALSASKATIYRHLVTLQRHGFVRQESETGRYAAGIKLMVLGEALRQRFDIVSAAREELMSLRDRTGQAVTICAALDDELIVLELIQGRTLIEFSTRPGTRLAFHASAHGKIWLAFGCQARAATIVDGPLEAWTPATIVSREALLADLQGGASCRGAFGDAEPRHRLDQPNIVDDDVSGIGDRECVVDDIADRADTGLRVAGRVADRGLLGQ